MGTEILINRVSPCSFTDYDLFWPSSCKENIILYAGRFIREESHAVGLLSNPAHKMNSVCQIGIMMMETDCALPWRCLFRNLKEKVVVVPYLVELMRKASIFVSPG